MNGATRSKLQPELGALLGLDYGGRGHPWTASGIAVSLFGSTLVGLLTAFLFLRGQTSELALGDLAGLVAPAWCVMAVTLFGTAAVRSPSIQIMATLPCRNRALYSYSLLRSFYGVADWYLILLVGPLVVLWMLDGPGTALGYAAMAMLVPAFTAAAFLGLYLSALTALGPRLLRWLAWAALAAFATVPIAAVGAGFGFMDTLWTAGPGFIVVAAIEFALSAGVIGVATVTAGFFAIAVAFAFAPIGRAYDASARFHPSAELDPTSDRWPDLWPPGLVPTSERQRARFAVLKASGPAPGGPPSHRPLRYPEGQVASLRYRETPGLSRSDKLALLVGLPLIVLIPLPLLLMGPPVGLPRWEQMFALVVLPLPLLPAVARAPGALHEWTLLKMRFAARKTPDGYTKRYAQSPSPWGWVLLQALPIERRVMERAFFVVPLAGLIASVGVILALPAVFAPDALLLDFLYFFAVPGALCLVGIFGGPVFAFAALNPDRGLRHNRVWELGIFCWVLACILLPIAVAGLAFGQLGRGWHATPLAAASAGLWAFGVLQVALLYQGARELLVTSQRPYLSQLRYELFAFGGPAALVAAMAVLVLRML